MKRLINWANRHNSNFIISLVSGAIAWLLLPLLNRIIPADLAVAIQHLAIFVVVFSVVWMLLKEIFSRNAKKTESNANAVTEVSTASVVENNGGTNDKLIILDSLESDDTSR